MVPASLGSFNLKKDFETGLQLATKLAPTWHSSPVPIKEKIQKAIFPSGITYNFKKGSFLTSEINPVFECIALLAQVSEDPKNKQGSISAALFCLVGRIRQKSNWVMNSLTDIHKFRNELDSILRKDGNLPK